MKKIKQLFEDFKKFITRGNVVDMAIGVIIGAAFSAIVTSMTNGIIMPLVNWAVGGESAFDSLITMLVPAYQTVEVLNEAGAVVGTQQVLDMANSIYIDWGTFLNKTIDFLLIALVLFAIIKVVAGVRTAATDINAKAKKRMEKMAKKLQKKGMSEEEAKAQVEAQVVTQAPAEPPKPTTEELLIQIRDLLAAQNANAAPNQEIKTTEE